MNDPIQAALEYLGAVERKEFHRIKDLLAPDLAFTGPSTVYCTAEDFISGLKRLAAIHVRSDVKRVFADGNEACVIYDFVTDTPVGALPAVEWLHMDAERRRIRSIHLYYDRVPWMRVLDEMAYRAGLAH
jgi:SnoaL-like domain